MNDDIMNENGKISIIIKNHNLDFDLINTLTLVNATRTIKKGEKISKVISESENDVWIFEESFNSKDEINRTIIKIINNLNFCKSEVNVLTERYDIELKCFIQSDYAQMYFELLPQTIEIIARAKIKFKVSIISWGGA